jgi:hypothetical protein
MRGALRALGPGPYFQYFTSEEFFQHAFSHERSDLSHWRKRLGDGLHRRLAESLRVAHEVGALRGQDLKRRTVDTTVQPKAITFPADATLLHAAIKGLNRLATKHGVRLRQSYPVWPGRRDDGEPLRPCQAVSSGISGSCASCAAGSAGSSAISVARSKGRMHLTRRSHSRLAAPRRSARSSSASAAARCIRSTPRGHDAENPRCVFISGQKRDVFGAIRRELRRRSTIEPVIGHLKAEGHLGHCYLKGRAGDAANVILSAVGHNFRRILAWLSNLLRLNLIHYAAPSQPQSPTIRLFNGRLR